MVFSYMLLHPPTYTIHATRGQSKHLHLRLRLPHLPLHLLHYPFTMQSRSLLSYLFIMPLLHGSKFPETVECDEDAVGESGDACDDDSGLTGSGEAAGLGAVNAGDCCEDTG